jgi:hypothetical protein
MEDYERTFGEVLSCFDQREIRKALRSGYRKVGNKAAKLVREASHSRIRVLGDRRSWDKSIRVRVYPKGGGFVITTKFHGKQGFHRNRFGLEKPIVMWAAEGTVERYVRRNKGMSLLWRQRYFSGGLPRRGRMPRYGFVDATTGQTYMLVEAELFKELDAAVTKRAEKLGVL